MNFVNKYLSLLSVLIAVAILVAFHLLNQIPPDAGDGISHYFLVSGVWKDPTFLVNHWGKPLFILFASPFAYFGFFSYIFFNILVFFLTVIIGQNILKTLNVGVWAQWLYPFVLISITDYTTNVLGGLTEPFFGLLLVLSIWLFLQNRWLLFAIVISFLPFARSEGQFVVVLAVFLLIAVKQWKYLPFLGAGFLFYAIIGAFLLHDFLWYFHNDPYQGAQGIYGHGNWDHYLINWKAHLGQGGLLLLFGSVISIIVGLFKKQKIERTKLLLLLFIATIYFGIIAVHGYLWATGQKGAYGLSRLATHGIPAILLVYLYLVGGLFAKTPLIIRRLLFLAYLGLLIVLIKNLPFPKVPGEFDQQVIESAKYVKKHQNEFGRIYYYHPLFAEEFGVNQNLPNEKSIQFVFNNLNEDLKSFHSGDIIVRDSHFGPMEMGLTFEKIDASFGQLKLLKSFVSKEENPDQSDTSQFSKVEIYQFTKN